MDFEEKLDLTDGECVILDHIHVASKLQMYDAEFHKHHYRFVDCIDDAVELEAQVRISGECDHRMMGFLRRMTNLLSLENIVPPPPNQRRRQFISVHIVPVYG